MDDLFKYSKKLHAHSDQFINHLKQFIDDLCLLHGVMFESCFVLIVFDVRNSVIWMRINGLLV